MLSILLADTASGLTDRETAVALVSSPLLHTKVQRRRGQTTTGHPRHTHTSVRIHTYYTY